MVEYVERKGVDVDTTAYDEIDVNPTALHAKKGDHEDAVDELMESLIDSLDDASDIEADTPTATASAD